MPIIIPSTAFVSAAHLARRSGIDSDNHATHHRDGKLKSWFLPIGVVTYQLKKSSPSSPLAFVSSSNTSVSQAGSESQSQQWWAE